MWHVAHPIIFVVITISDENIIMSALIPIVEIGLDSELIHAKFNMNIEHSIVIAF